MSGRPKISKNVKLCLDTWDIASDMDNFSLWVREMLQGHDEWVRIADLSDRRILAILLARIQSNEKFGFESPEANWLVELMKEL